MKFDTERQGKENMKGEERDMLRVEQVFLPEMLLIGLSSIKILSLETKLIFIPCGYQNTKRSRWKGGNERKIEGGERNSRRI